MTQERRRDQGMKRIRYFDLLRIISFIMVIFYHMMIQLQLDGICPEGRLRPFYQNGNIHMATLAVALFFMLSGAGLTVSAERGFSLKKYYKGRFERLLIPFYLAVLALYLLALVFHHRPPVVFSSGTPAWRYIFTVLGVDEWVSMHGYSTFSTGIGEWFLGALIILSVLFPVFYFCMKRRPVIFLAACFGVYLFAALSDHFSVPVHMNLLLKGFEFVLGMYFGRYMARIPKAVRAAAAMPAVIICAGFPVLNISTAFIIPLAASAVFVSVSLAEPLLQKGRTAFLAKAALYSYPVFLVHHQVIFRMTPLFAPYYSGAFSVALFFLAEAAVMVLAGILLKLLADCTVRLINGQKIRRVKAGDQ